MEKQFGCEVQPYLFGDNRNDRDDMESKVQIGNKAIGNSAKYETRSEDLEERDYTIEKFIFYDDFMKKLQVLNIIHTACIMCQQILGVG